MQLIYYYQGKLQQFVRWTEQNKCVFFIGKKCTEKLMIRNSYQFHEDKVLNIKLAAHDRNSLYFSETILKDMSTDKYTLESRFNSPFSPHTFEQEKQLICIKRRESIQFQAIVPSVSLKNFNILYSECEFEKVEIEQCDFVVCYLGLPFCLLSCEYRRRIVLQHIRN